MSKGEKHEQSILSGFNVLAKADEYALKELDAQNRGNAKNALKAALENMEELYSNKGDPFEAPQ